MTDNEIERLTKQADDWKKIIAQKDREIAGLRAIGTRLLYHDERGQGIGWQEAMNDLKAAIEEQDEKDSC